MATTLLFKLLKNNLNVNRIGSSIPKQVKECFKCTFLEETLRQIPYALMLLKEPNPRLLLSLFLPDLPYSYNMGGGYNPGYGYSGYGNVSDQRIDFKPELDDSTRSLLERAKNVRQNPVWDEEIRYLLGCNFSFNCQQTFLVRASSNSAMTYHRHGSIPK